MRHKLSRDHRAKLLDILAVNHSHSEMTQWALCQTCQDKFQEYKKAKTKLTELERKELHLDILERAVRLYIPIKNAQNSSSS